MDKMQVTHSDEEEEEQILELDRDKLYLVADTFSSVSMYLNSNLEHGYLGLNGPDLYSFQLPHPDAQHNGVTEVQDNFDILYNWEKEDAYEINMIEPEDEQKLGVLQHDPETGELYMLMPLEIDVILQPDLLTCSINDQIDASNMDPKTVPQSDELNSSIGDPKKKAIINLDSDNLIALTSDSSTDTYKSPASDHRIALDRNQADPEPLSDSEPEQDDWTEIPINPEEKLSQETLTQEEASPDIKAPDAPDADADGGISSICDVVLPKMNLNFSLSFNFDELCINPEDYGRKSLSRNRNIYNAAEMHKQGDKHYDKQIDKLIDNNE